MKTLYYRGFLEPKIFYFKVSTEPKILYYRVFAEPLFVYPTIRLWSQVTRFLKLDSCCMMSNNGNLKPLTSTSSGFTVVPEDSLKIFFKFIFFDISRAFFKTNTYLSNRELFLLRISEGIL